MILNALFNLAKIFKLNDNFANKSSNLYIVGGFVRDYLLNIKNNDIDICSSLTLNEVEKILEGSDFKIKIKNNNFGTAVIYNKNFSFEYSVFRKDFYSNKNLGKHSPNKVEFVNSLNEDAERRDFTINCLYLDILKNKIIDPFNALEDLNKKIIKAVPPIKETLKYDGERILRLAKYKTKLNFEIEASTLHFAKLYAKNVESLSDKTLQKFLDSIKDFNKKQKEKIKKFFIELNLNSLEKLI